MSLLETGLLGTALFAVAATLVALLAPRPSYGVASSVLTAALGCTGLATGGAALAGQTTTIELPGLLPLSGLYFHVDPLGGLFLAATGLVTTAAAIYAIGYGSSRGATHAVEAGRTVTAVLPLFVLTMLLIPLAASVSTLLVMWELMAVTSTVLVLTEHRERPEVRQAGLWYAIMTHLGFVLILLGTVLFAAQAGTETFDGMRAAATTLSPAAASAVFLLVLGGFGSKAGMVPLHAWLPRAHAEAPSHLSALMSAAMVNLGLYGILRVGWDLLGGGPRWWAVVVLALGSISAVYGALQAVVATDLKRLLAYSTTENMGMVMIGIGAAGYFAASDSPVLAGLALAAALLHIVNHSTFKGLLFLGAGSVLRATGTRDLDALGGLRSRMPATTAWFSFGALAAAALPPANGFVSEWLLLQSLTHSGPGASVTGAVMMPLAVGAVALATGLAIAAFVKAFGVGFLARPRSDVARDATESPRTMTTAMAVLGVVAGLLAVLPTVVVPALSRAIAVVVPGQGAPVEGALTLRLEGIASSLSPVLIAAGLAGGVALALAGVRIVGARTRPARRTSEIWGCGGSRLSPRMEYTATSYAEPLQRVFDDVLRPDQNVDVSHYEESRYIVATVRFHRDLGDGLERRFYQPVLAGMRHWATVAARQVATGSVHRYLAYGFASFVGLLLVLAVLR